jgi:hypothetical protein
MEPGEVVREAWRDVSTGVARPLLAAGVLALIMAMSGVWAARGVVDLSQEAREFRTAGASTAIMTMEMVVDGAVCDSLATYPGIEAAGALRPVAQGVRFAVSPSRAIPLFEVSVGFIDLLSVIGAARANPDGGGVSGVWLPEATAEALGLAPEGPWPDLAIPAGGQVRVAGLYTFPEDGRQQDLSFAVLAPVPAPDGLALDSCWAELWPATYEVSRLAVAVEPLRIDGSKAVNPTFAQLNSTLGEQFDGPARFAEVARAPGVALAGAASLAAGFVLIRVRRLELADSRHCGLSWATQGWTMLAEAACWILPAAAVAAPVVLIAALAGNPEPPGPAAAAGAMAVVCAAAGAAVGTLLGTWTIAERQLFQMVKNR